MRRKKRRVEKEKQMNGRTLVKSNMSKKNLSRGKNQLMDRREAQPNSTTVLEEFIISRSFASLVRPLHTSTDYHANASNFVFPFSLADVKMKRYARKKQCG